MKAYELLTEAGLQPSEMRKHAGLYIRVLIRKIEDGEPLMVVPEQRKKYGDSVILDRKNIKNILIAWFGKSKFPEIADMNLKSNGDIEPADPKVAALRLVTIDGREITFGALLKTPDFKGGKTFNAGDIGEGMLGAAVTAKFLARDRDITEADVINVIKKLGAGEQIGNNIRGSMSGPSANDTVYYNLSLNQANYNALIGSARNPREMHSEILGALRSAVLFANRNAGIAAALGRIMSDKNKNKVTVNSDGVSDQRGTKADLFLDIDGTTVNLLSLKVGDVKQFGQASGHNFQQLDKFFNETFGVNLPNTLQKYFNKDDAYASFSGIRKVYSRVATELNNELSGKSISLEAKLVERLYRGIQHHATRGEEGTSMVILKTTPNAAGYSELRFGQALRDAMEQVDLDVEVDAPEDSNQAKLEIFGTLDNGSRAMLLRLRSNIKSESRGYVRNIVEMGPLLKVIAAIEKQADAEKDKKPSKPATAKQPAKPTTTVKSAPKASVKAPAAKTVKPVTAAPTKAIKPVKPISTKK